MTERLLNPISEAELQRRWTAARSVMSDNGLDALVMQSNNDWLGGNVKWFSDMPAVNGYPRTIVFHANDWMTVIDMGSFDGRRQLRGEDAIHRGVGEFITTPAFTSVAYTDTYHADLVVEDIRRRDYRSIGLVGVGGIPHGFVSSLEEQLEGTVDMVDVTDAIDRLKASKSPEEIELIRKAAAIQDEVLARVMAQIRPGMRDTEVTALAQYEGRRLDSEQGLFLGTSAPLGRRSDFIDRHFQNRALQAGDHFSLLIENNGPGGMYTEIARTMVLGKASNELLDGFAAMQEAQEHTLQHMMPGTPARDVASAHDAFMDARRLPRERRLYAHSQGYDLVERPLIRADETMTIEAGMNFAVHPGYESDTLFAVICDNYLIGEDGPGECLHRTEKKVFEFG